MRILAIDTTTKFLCLGFYDHGKIYEYNLDLGRKHSALLITTIKRVLDALSLKIGEIDYFACGRGPGSFTGVRVGLSTIKGMAWAIKKPVLGISTLDVVAANAKDAKAREIAPMIDAKRNLVYSSIYKMKNGQLKRIAPYLLLSVEEFLKKIKPGSVVLGDAVSLYKEKILKNLKNLTLLDNDYWYPQARNLITLSLECIREKKISNSFKIKPIYLYPKDCQVNKES